MISRSGVWIIGLSALRGRDEVCCVTLAGNEPIRLKVCANGTEAKIRLESHENIAVHNKIEWLSRAIDPDVR